MSEDASASTLPSSLQSVEELQPNLTKPKSGEISTVPEENDEFEEGEEEEDEDEDENEELEDLEESDSVESVISEFKQDSFSGILFVYNSHYLTAVHHISDHAAQRPLRLSFVC